MAKKPKMDAEPQEPGAEAPLEGGARKKKTILFGALGVALLAAAGGGGYFFLKHPKAEAANAQAEKKPVAFLDVREMLVNLAPEPNQVRPHFLKFKAALEVKDAKVVSEVQPLLPRVEDAFQVFMRELRATDLEGSAGMYRLREELLRRVNVAVYPAKVDAVLFKEVVVQ
jgi:flagellar FliL protein